MLAEGYLGRCCIQRSHAANLDYIAAVSDLNRYSVGVETLTEQGEIGSAHNLEGRYAAGLEHGSIEPASCLEEAWIIIKPHRTQSRACNHEEDGHRN